jgi:hypothetical protein
MCPTGVPGVCAMNGRLENIIESLIIGLVVFALAGLVDLLAKLIFKKSIGTSKYYSAVGVLAVLAYAALISIPPKTDTAESARRIHSDNASVDVVGLDAQFIAPPKDRMESFVGQLDTAIKQLSPSDKANFIESMGFLTYAAAEYIKENEPARFAKWDEKDVAAHSLNKMYNFAQDNGDKMTLRKYILLADDMKKQKPDWLRQYLAANKQP